MDFRGRTERRKSSRDRRVSHPLSIGARMMVRVSERAFYKTSIWVVSQKLTLLSQSNAKIERNGELRSVPIAEVQEQDIVMLIQIFVKKEK